jgi:hypothetical protein
VNPNRTRNTNAGIRGPVVELVIYGIQPTNQNGKADPALWFICRFENLQAYIGVVWSEWLVWLVKGESAAIASL